MANIYLATSWKNPFFEETRDSLRWAGHVVYDFRKDGFSWSKIGLDPNPENEDFDGYLEKVHLPEGDAGFNRDMDALQACTHCVLLLPSGRSAHIEAGWAKGSGRKLCVYVPQYDGPDLMWRMADKITDNFADVAAWLEEK